ncbi:hypothetical protein QTP70_031067 [Hemibagrus guttatus]|uniref:Uncharacterized protein n=1 Tax=Hemibagrus guttatus TaxID=175788 RepID=A0AAE0PY84_9TELE|nr:hypothetical protein QTP70_031067 [Hemibagrus guttatus]
MALLSLLRFFWNLIVGICDYVYQVDVWRMKAVKKIWRYFQGWIDFILEKVGWSKGPRFHVMVIGNDMNCHKDILSRLDISPKNKVTSADQSDVIMAFVPIGSRAGTDIQAALQKIPENRPVVFMVLHHTFNPDYIAPDSSRAIRRSNVFSVDLLYHEDQGMLKCKRNTEDLEATKKYLQDIQQVDVWRMKAVKKIWRYFQGWIDFILEKVGWSKVLRFHVMVIGNDMNCHKDILSRLDISPKNKVTSVDQSDVIMAFVPIVSRAGTDIQAALQKIPENRPVVFMVLHHTFNPDCIAPDSSREIRRSNVFSVDLLFHEDQGMLKCKRNTEALEATKKYLQDIQDCLCDRVRNRGYQLLLNWSISQSREVGPRFHVMVIGNDMNCHKDILRRLDISPKNKVTSADQSDVIMAFVPIVSRAGTDIQAALQKIPENRPVVFMALHYTFDPNYIAPDSSRAIRRSNVFSVDLLYHEDQGMLKCKRNTEALDKAKKYLQDIQQDEVDFTSRKSKKGWIHFILEKVGQPKVLRFHVMVIGNDMNCHKDILSRLDISPQNKVISADQSDVIMAFVPIVSRAGTDIQAALQKIPVGRSKVLRFHVMVIGNDMNCHKDILSRLGISSQDEEISVYQSDIIMAFVPIVSRAGTDIQAALQKIPENRPVVFMALHYTFDPDYIAPDSSREIHRSNVFSVDLLYHEDQGMLNCKRNTEALEATKKYLQNIQQVVVWRMKAVGRPKVLRFHVMVIGNDMNCHKDILSRLDISSQDEEISADQSDVIIAFVPIVSRAGTDIQAALQKIPENRPVVFMVLHHTFDPDYIAPDSSREIRRSNVFSVDLLFHEDQGMLKCKRNTEALDKAKKYLQDIQVNYNDKLQC